MKTTKPMLVLLLLLAFTGTVTAQQVVKITYDRKTNLVKKFKDDDDMGEWLKDINEKVRVDAFELFVTDTISLFRPVESDLQERWAWMTAKNVVYQDFIHNSRYTVKNFWGEELHIADSLYKRTWKISTSTRKIAGYMCRKAMWQANDSTRIYAWFSYELTVSTGPESFNGLPGTILGLATEDGGVVYFAKKIEFMATPAGTFDKPRKKKIQQAAVLKADLTKQYGKEKWFKRMYEEHFGIW